MNGVDLVIMTGGIGENGTIMREAILSDMEFFGIELDREANIKYRGEDGIISKPNSKTIAMSITTNEEFVIANDTYHLVK